VPRFDVLSSKEHARAAQEEAAAKAQADINQLPPGYISGFTVRMDNEYKVTISSGITSVWGQQVNMAAEYKLSDYDFYTLKTGPYLYYIYLTPEGEFKVDRGKAVQNDEQKGYVHPNLNWRCIGKLWVSTAGLVVWAHTGAI
jgi:hypothetical protein